MELVALDHATTTVSLHWTDAERLVRACAAAHQGEACDHFDLLAMFWEGVAFAGHLHGSVHGAEAVSLADFRTQLGTAPA